MARHSRMLATLAATSALLAQVVHSDSPISPGFPYGSEKVRGVNLGGWLVLEPWITPSLFDDTGNDAIVDEWTFCQMQDRGTAEGVLQNHWNTFYTEDDFADIAAAGYVLCSLFLVASPRTSSRCRLSALMTVCLMEANAHVTPSSI